MRRKRFIIRIRRGRVANVQRSHRRSARRPNQLSTRSKIVSDRVRENRRFWIQITVSALPGVAAVAALIFTSISLHETNVQLQVTEQGQITDRFNAAVSNLASNNTVIQLGGIYGLQGVMRDSPRDQPSVVNVLSSYIRFHAPIPAKFPSIANSTLPSVSDDVQAALTVLGTRNPADDRGATVDLENTNLYSADLEFLNLSGANMSGTILLGADLFNADFEDADLSDAALMDMRLSFVNLSGATLESADLDRAGLQDDQLGCSHKIIFAPGLGHTPSTDGCIDLEGASLKGTTMSDIDLSGAVMGKADLTDVNLDCVNMSSVFLTGATLRGAYLNGVDLSDTVFSGVNVTGAELINVKIPDLAFSQLNVSQLKHPPETQPDQCTAAGE